MSQTILTDVLVIGSGAAGIGTALKAAQQGHSVLVIEKDQYLGGTSAICGGWGWVPGNKGGTDDTRAEAKQYIEALALDSYNEEMVDVFLDAVPEAMQFFEDEGVQMVYGAMSPDYQMDAPGAKEKGRAVTFKRADARILGEDRLRVQPYLMPYTVYGYMPEIGPDIAKMLKANQSLPNFLYATKNVLTTWAQTALYKRAYTRTNGNALMTWMFAAARNAGIRMWTNTEATELITDADGVVTGARITVSTPARSRPASAWCSLRAASRTTPSCASSSSPTTGTATITSPPPSATTGTPTPWPRPWAASWTTPCTSRPRGAP